MNWLRRDTSRRTSSEPLWKEEFSVRTADECYVTRRQLTNSSCHQLRHVRR